MADINEINKSFETGRQQDAQNRKKKMVAMRKETLSQVDPDIKKRFHHLETQYFQLKYAFNKKKSSFCILEALDQDHIPSVEELDGGLKHVGHSMTELREKLRSCKPSVEELAESAQTLYEEFETFRAALSQLVEESDAKRGRVADLLDQVQGDLNNGCNMQLKGAEDKLKKLRDSLAITGHRIAELDSQKSALRDSMSFVQQGVKDAHYISQYLAATKSKIKWCEACTELLKKFTNVRETSIQCKTWTLELFTLSRGADSPTLQLAITFNFMASGVPQIVGVKYEWVDFDLKNIIDETIKRNDIGYLLTETTKVWNDESSVVNEVEKLRDKYAMDWVHSEGKLRVLFGKAVPMVCTLRVESGYPDNGVVILEKINDITRGEKLDKLKPASERPTLTEWLDYLHGKMVSGLNAL